MIFFSKAFLALKINPDTASPATPGTEALIDIL